MYFIFLVTVTLHLIALICSSPPLFVACLTHRKQKTDPLLKDMMMKELAVAFWFYSLLMVYKYDQGNSNFLMIKILWNAKGKAV